MGYRKRTDANQGAIATALGRLGWYVKDTSRLGEGFADLVVARAGVLRMIEVKDGAKSKSRRALTPAETACHRHFKAAGCPVIMIETVADAEALR